MERLTKNINGMVWFASQDTELWLEPYEMSTHDIRTAIKKLAAYEDAVEKGHLVSCPCKLGDTVWVLHTGFNANFSRLYQGRCVEISQSLLYGSAEESYAVDVIDFAARYRKSDIGSTLFFSQAEAEAALKKRREE